MAEPTTKASYMEPVPDEEKKVEKVVTGKVTTQKKTTGQQLKEAFIGDAKEVKGYLLWEVFIPAVKDTIVDLIKNGAEALFYGADSQRKSSTGHVKRNGAVSYVSYSDYSKPKKSAAYKGAQGWASHRSVYDFDDVAFSSRVDAENVLDALVSYTMSYGVASVADFRELAGLPINYTDHKYGWGELSGARVVQRRNGYFIELPRPEVIYD